MTDVSTPLDADATGTAAPDGPDTAPRRTFVQWLRERDRLEVYAWLGLLAVAIIVRVIGLGNRPFHHDESQDAYFSYQFFTDPNSYRYDPLLHGPFRFYLTALNYKLFGDSNVTARLAPAYMGVIAVGLPYLLRRELGRVGAFAVGVVLAVGPSYLYFSRFAREDIYLSALMLGVIVGVFRFVNRPRAVTLIVTFVLASLAFATKESGMVMCGLIVLFLIGSIVLALMRDTPSPVLRAVVAVGWPAWVYAVAAYVVVYSAMFTVFFTQATMLARVGDPHNPTSTHKPAIAAVWHGLGYWRGQQEVARGNDPAWLYPSIIVSNEWPVLLLAFVGLYATIRRPTLFRAFALFYAVTTMAFYCWGSERFAWLILHPLLPLILLAGVGVQHLVSQRTRVARVAGYVAIGIGALYMVVTSYVSNVKEGADPKNMLVSTQSSTQVKQVADEVLALDRAYRRTHNGQGLTVTVDAGEGATYPYAWYFRRLSAGYPVAADTPPASQVEILTEAAYTAQRPNLQAYDCRQFDFRVWWIKSPYSADPGDWWRWFTQRETWTVTGGMREWFCLRRDVGPLPGKGTTTQIPTA